LDAVKWAWDGYQHSSGSRVLDPESQSVDNLRRYIAERWDVSIRSVTDDNAFREAVGWYDHTSVYIPRDRIREATGGILKQTQIGAMLDRRRLLASRPEPDRYTVSWVPGVGGVKSYALRRSEVGRSVEVKDPQNPFKVYEGAADD